LSTFNTHQDQFLHIACALLAIFSIIAGLCQPAIAVAPPANEKRPVWEIIPQTLSLTEPRKVKLSGFVINLSQDNRKEILKITGEPSIGRAVARLRKFVED
jgi:hypothetical protein